MRFEYLFLADAANSAADGKINVLGLGVRILTYSELPASSPLVIVGAVEATVEEAGDYALRVELFEPDGTIEELVNAAAKVTTEVKDSRVPTGIGFTIALSRPFRQEGVHVIRATVANEVAQYAFVVRRREGAASTPGDEATIAAATTG